MREVSYVISLRGTGITPLGAMPPPELLTGIPIVSPAGTGSDALRTESLPAAVDTTAIGAAVPATSTAPPPSSLGHALDGSSLMCNLLPSVGQSADLTGQAGIYVGEGLLPVPAKLAERIARWEFTEMAELLPEFWTPLNPRETSSNPATTQSGTRRKRAVTDIATWLQCFATYTSVMSTAHLQAVPETPGIPNFHPAGQPGFWRGSLGDLRCGVQTTGSNHR